MCRKEIVQERGSVVKFTKMGVSYYDREDIESFCSRCKSAYYNDWSIQDCDYCAFSKILEKQKQYALTLDGILRESVIAGNVTSWHGKSFNEICN